LELLIGSSMGEPMRTLSLAALMALTASITGCMGTSDDDLPPPQPMGTLTTMYTIGGSTNPAMCSQHQVTTAELVVYSTAGSFITEERAACADFKVSTRLFPGVYNIELTLLDHVDRVISVPQPLFGLDLPPDSGVVVNIDFPPASML
jgi:hypothetical protein